MRGVLDPLVSAFSLSLYRHPFLYTLFRSRFTLIINNPFQPYWLSRVESRPVTKHVTLRLHLQWLPGRPTPRRVFHRPLYSWRWMWFIDGLTVWLTDSRSWVDTEDMLVFDVTGIVFLIFHHDKNKFCFLLGLVTKTNLWPRYDRG